MSIRKEMFPIFAALLIATNIALAQEFLPYEGRDAVREGDGGTKKIVDGIEFWADGAPPKQFKLLGYITDRRHKSGLFGMISMSSLETDVAAAAKTNGGDAVILVSSEAETVGTTGSSRGSAQGRANSFGGTTTARSTGSSTTSSQAVQKSNSKYAVVKFLPKDEPPAVTTPLPQPATSESDAVK